MTDGMKQYRRVLKRKLRCSWGVRKRLLEKFDDAAFSYLENEPTPALAEVTEAFGPPEEMALDPDGGGHAQGSGCLQAGYDFA